MDRPSTPAPSGSPDHSPGPGDTEGSGTPPPSDSQDHPPDDAIGGREFINEAYALAARTFVHVCAASSTASKGSERVHALVMGIGQKLSEFVHTERLELGARVLRVLHDELAELYRRFQHRELTRADLSRQINSTFEARGVLLTSTELKALTPSSGRHVTDHMGPVNLAAEKLARVIKGCTVKQVFNIRRATPLDPSAHLTKPSWLADSSTTTKVDALRWVLRMVFEVSPDTADAAIRLIRSSDPVPAPPEPQDYSFEDQEDFRNTAIAAESAAFLDECPIGLRIAQLPIPSEELPDYYDK